MYKTILNRNHTVKQSSYAYFFEIGWICKILKLLILLQANCTFSITLRPRFVRYNHSLIHDYSYFRCLEIRKIHGANVCVPYQKVLIAIIFMDGKSYAKELYNISGWLQRSKLYLYHVFWKLQKLFADIIYLGLFVHTWLTLRITYIVSVFT